MGSLISLRRRPWPVRLARWVWETLHAFWFSDPFGRRQ